MADILIYGAINSMAGDNKAAYASQVYDEEQEEFQGEINKKVVNDCAKINGYYETMGVGTATNLKGQTVTDNEFIYRKSGGSQEVATGGAYIESIKGNTLAWNQLIENGDFNNSNNWTASSGTIIAENNILTFTCTTSSSTNGVRTTTIKPFIIGHKYYITANIKTSETATVHIAHGLGSGTSLWLNCETTNTSKKFSFIINNNNVNDDKIGFRILDYTVNATMQLKEVMVLDLTLIYGAGNEPSTPEEFEADYQRWFGKPLTYEPYDAGSLRNVQMQGLKTTGFNQWDEEWVQGTIDGTGKYVSSGNRVVAANFIKVLPNISYYKTSNVAWVFFYDKEKKFISNTSASPFVIPANCAFIRFYTIQNYGTTYNNDICINISDTNKNGTYEPYEEHNVSVPVTTLTGKVNGQGESVVIFPDGMKGVKNIKDEIKVENGVTKAIKRVGRVDLGSLTYSLVTGVFLSSGISDMKAVGTGSIRAEGILCWKYSNDTQYAAYAPNMNDKSILRSMYNSLGVIVIRDDNYTDAATFKTAMSGVYLDYELAEPVEYVVDEFGLPLNYLVNTNGTEEVTMPESVTSYAAPTISIRYGMNAVGTLSGLPKAYISEESMDAFLSALGVQMGGTWTKTWNSTTNKYTFSFSPSSGGSSE